MLYDQYTSIKVVIAKVYRDLQLQEEDKIGDMIEWAGEAMDLIGTYGQYKDKSTMVPVATYTAILPSDFYQLGMVSFNNRPLRKVTDVFGVNSSNTIPIDTTTYIVNEESLYNSTFIGNVATNGIMKSYDASYSIDGRTIRTSFEEGMIGIQYTARVLDDDNWPMIPDTTEFREAIFRYIVYKMYFADYIRGKISPNMYKELEQDWYRKCRQARADSNMPDLATMQNLATSYLSLKPNVNQYDTFFHNLNNNKSFQPYN